MLAEFLDSYFDRLLDMVQSKDFSRQKAIVFMETCFPLNMRPLGADPISEDFFDKVRISDLMRLRKFLQAITTNDDKKKEKGDDEDNKNSAFINYMLE